MTRPKNVDDLYPLSPMQRLMLLHAISEDGNGVLLNQVCYDIRGALDAEAFRRAWEMLVARHASLRTAFLWEGLPQPVQVVRSTVALPFRTVDLSALAPAERVSAIEALRREDADAPLALGKAPLMRCTLVKLGDDHYRFIWSVHHLVVDRWSHAVLFDELRTIYVAQTSGEEPRLGPPVSFREYVAWIERQDRTAAERFWRDELSGVREMTPLNGVAAYESSARLTTRLTTRLTLSADVTMAVRTRAAQWRTTPGALLQSAVGLLLAGRAGRDDVMYGLVVSGRPSDLAGAAEAIGSFVNDVPARLRVPRDRPLGAWVQEIHRAEGRRQGFVHVSPVDIHEWSALPAGRALFDTLVLLNLTDESDGAWPGLQFVADAATLDARYPFLLAVGTTGDRFVLTLVHDASTAQPEQLLGELGVLLGRVATADDGATLGDLLPPAAPPRPALAGAAPPNANGAAARHKQVTATAAAAGEPVADALLRAWRDVLGTGDIGLDDDFFAVGGTSLQAAQLFARVERIVGRSLPLSTLFGAGSVRALLAELGRPLPRSGALVTIRSSSTRAPLYAVPGVDGNIVGFYGLARHLGPDQPFSAFESPGLDGREPPLLSIEAIAQRYADELALRAPHEFHLLGICWGAAVVFEMARRLHALGRGPTSLALLNPAVLLRDPSARPPRAELSFARGRLQLYWDEFRERNWRDRSRMLADKARRAAKVLSGGEELERSLSELNQARVLEANMHAVTRYLPQHVTARARIFLTNRDGDEGDDPRLEWFTLIEPVPSVASIGGRGAGTAISPAHVGGFASALQAWLMSRPEA